MLFILCKVPQVSFLLYSGVTVLIILLLYLLLFTYPFSVFLKGPETLLRQSSKLAGGRRDGFEGDSGDTVEAHQWKCILTVAGIFLVKNIHYFVVSLGSSGFLL
jgi:hypothetical protein